MGSLAMAVSLLVAIAVVLAWGTIYEARHGTASVQRFIYHAWWFQALLAFLGINLAVAALERWPWQRRHIPFVLAHIGSIAAAHRIDRAEAAGADNLTERRLVLVEAVTHGDRHLAASFLHLGRDAEGRRHGVGDRLFAKNVEAVGDGGVSHRLVEIGRDDDGAEIGLHGAESGLRVGEAGAGGQPKRGAAKGKRLLVNIDEADNLDGPIGDVGGQKIGAPAATERANPDVNNAFCHGPIPLFTSRENRLWRRETQVS